MNPFTVLEAIQYANSFIYIFNNVKTARYYGSGSTRITVSRKANYDTQEKVNYGSHQITFNNTSTEIAALPEIIKESFPNFNPADYEMTIYHTGENNYTIDFIKKIGNFRTNDGYILTITNGILKEIKPILNNVTISENQYEKIMNINNSNDLSKTITSKNLKANLEIIKKEQTRNITILAQENEYYYDLLTNKAYLLTNTTYTVDGESKAQYGYMQEI